LVLSAPQNRAKKKDAGIGIEETSGARFAMNAQQLLAEISD
jgi:hypothetical protein